MLIILVSCDSKSKYVLILSTSFDFYCHSALIVSVLDNPETAANAEYSVRYMLSYSCQWMSGKNNHLIRTMLITRTIQCFLIQWLHCLTVIVLCNINSNSVKGILAVEKRTRRSPKSVVYFMTTCIYLR